MYLKIFFFRTTTPEMPMFIQKLVYIMEIPNCEHCDPQPNTRAPIGVQSLTEQYIEKMFNNLLHKNYNAIFVILL